jgi:xanthine dehydrogenase accessory factor
MVQGGSQAFLHLLTHWWPLREQAQWALAAVIETQGSAYRKTGALMLLSDSGHQLGLISGGCLEAQLALEARKVWALGRSRERLFDSQDDDAGAGLLGCGGQVRLLLHPCDNANQYLQLGQMLQLLEQGQSCQYRLHRHSPRAECQPQPRRFVQPAARLDAAGWLHTLVNPLPHLAVFGGGLDMRPLCQMALLLGFRVSLVERRLSALRRAEFPAELAVWQQAPAALPEAFYASLDAAVVAHHHRALDLEALLQLQTRTPAPLYLGLLGPRARKIDLLAQLREQLPHLVHPVAGPMGLALGGDLPEAIALSVLAQCHAQLHGADGRVLDTEYAAAGRPLWEDVP